MNILINWLVSALAIVIASYIVPGVTLASFWTALVLAIVLGAINAFIRPLLLILVLPINIVTLGLFTFVLNALLVMFAGLIVPGFVIANFWWALLFSLVLSIVNAVFHDLSKKSF